MRRGFVLVPSEADAEHEAPARLRVEGGDRLGRHDRLALRDEADARTDDETVGDRGGHPQRDERIERALVLLREFVVARGRRRAATRRDVRVLGEVQRRETAILDGARELDHADRLVGREHGDPELHAGRVPTVLCQGRVVAITGAGRGIGREHALAFAREGAKVVVNDLGVARDGSGADVGPAQQVVDEIRAAGGEATANTDDIADWQGAQRLVFDAINTFGALDALVNNAGFLRDRMLFTTSEEEWDAVIRVHLKGHFAVTRHAAEYWRQRSKAGEVVDARIINTSSGAGLDGQRRAGHLQRGQGRHRRARHWWKRPRWRATASPPTPSRRRPGRA